ncbi:unnamed protein product [Effrenium voratum]|nr:unnamed protein product [Effrenium voratum]
MAGRWRKAPEAAGPHEAGHEAEKEKEEVVTRGESRWKRAEKTEPISAAPVSACAATSAGRSVGMGACLTLRSGLLMPQLGLGTRLLKGPELREAVKAALRSGYRLIDTAPGFGNEEELLNGIRAASLRREDVFLVTKLAPSEHGEEEVEEALQASLRRLGTSYVDLYLVQSPKGGSVIWTWDAMLSLRDRGLARAVGLCNFSAKHLASLESLSREMPEVVQVELHLGNQQRELTAYCAARNITVMAVR